jgi:Ca-activated chloride channel family protein
MYDLEQKIYLYGLAVIPVLVLIFLINLYWKRRKQREFGDLNLVKQMAPDASWYKQWLKFITICLAIAFICIGLVNPRIGTKMETVKREGIDIVFAVDVSKSMLCEDVAPNRLEKSKQLVSQIMSSLESDRVGIVAYAGSAFPVLPITTDYGAARMYLQSMNPSMVSAGGTSLDEAIELSAGFFEKQSATSKLLILISDGEDHSEGAADAAEDAKKAGIKILTIGVGTAKGGPIPLKRNGITESFQRDSNGAVVVTQMNESVLKSIADATKSGYINGSNTRAVVEYVKKQLENIEKTEFESTQMADYESQFQWFLGIGLFLLFIDVFFLEKRTGWLARLNLFNERRI